MKLSYFKRLAKYFLCLASLLFYFSTTAHAQWVPDISGWCNERFYVLTQARSVAMRLSNLGRIQESNRTLMDGLVRADVEASLAPEYTPMMGMAIKRGIQMATEVSAASAGAPNALRTVNHVLFSYYSLIDSLGRQLDIPHYLPTRCQSCEFYDQSAYNQTLMQSSRLYLNLVLMKLVRTRGQMLYPVGAPKGVLKAIELSVAYMIQDLEQSLDATLYSCSVNRLRWILQTLSDYNTGNSGFLNDAWILSEVYSGIRMALEGGNPMLPPRYPNSGVYSSGYAGVPSCSGVMR